MRDEGGKKRPKCYSESACATSARIAFESYISPRGHGYSHNLVRAPLQGASFSSSSSSSSSNLATRSDGRARNASRSDAGGSIGVLRQLGIAPRVRGVEDAFRAHANCSTYPGLKSWAILSSHFVATRQRRINRHTARAGRAGARPYLLLLTPGPRAPYCFLNLLPF
jgi:hypothetical protein